jgi:hypothetical protein
MLSRRYLAIIGLCMALLSPLISSQRAFASPPLGSTTGGAAATTSSLTCGNGCTASIQATFKGNSSSKSGYQNTLLPRRGHGGGSGQGGGLITYAPPPSGCSTIWAVGQSNLQGQGPAFGSALTATCYGNGAH